MNRIEILGQRVLAEFAPVPTRRTAVVEPTGLALCPIPTDQATHQPPDALVFDHQLDVATALEVLGAQGQAIAFVSASHGRTGVVTAEDLHFAQEWAGPRATVGSAVTRALVDIDCGEAVRPSAW